jgi:hypothetical protein
MYLLVCEVAVLVLLPLAVDRNIKASRHVLAVGVHSLDQVG